ncbi:MAG: bZIP transcription factor [Nitrososphaerota archaeon]
MLQDRVAYLDSEVSRLNSEITRLRNRVSELEAIASPFTRGRWQQIANIQAVGLGTTARVDLINIPGNSGVRIKFTTGGGVWGWGLGGPSTYGPWVGESTARADFYIYNVPSGLYRFASIAESGVSYEVVIEAFIQY